MENDVSKVQSQVPPPLIPINPPPLITPPPPPGPPRRGSGWMKLAIVLGVLLVASLLSQLRHLVHGVAARAKAGRQPHEHLEEVTFENNHSKSKIALLDISGIISSEPWNRSANNLVDLISDQLRLAGDDDAVKAVVLRVDSPGGEVLASDEIYRAIAAFQKDYKKPVVASMGGLAASGGYYVSAPCRWIVANELTITGSIGVIMHSYNYRGLLNKVGVRPEVFKSGRFKDMLSGEKEDEEILPEEKQMVQALIDETFDRFKKVVAEGRKNANEQNRGKGRKLADTWGDYADGRVLSGRQAYELGFVDELGNFDTAVERAKDLARIGDANLVQYERPFDLGNLFRLFGETESRALTIDLGVQLPKLQVGRLYFLSPNVLH
ncbi:MAG: signal peptide peptidase SppA [Verrucomicrobia bacterium]|nr:MAG: signal peptide peptidase SppA [Verrucomicrobiota bacterium]